MAVLRCWFDSRKDHDVRDPDPDELLGRAREYLEGYRGAIELELEFDDARVLRTPDIISVLIERENELKDRPLRR